MKLKDVVQSLLREVQQISHTETVVGESISVAGTKLIPISRLTLGFGAGVGGGEASAEAKGRKGLGLEMQGAGGGIKVQPVAFIAVDAEGGAQLLSFEQPDQGVVDKLLQIAPELTQQWLDKRRAGEVHVATAPEPVLADKVK